ncbi:MAG TPA: alkaline phosphatase family protein [Kofleriaceae bacterium]
MRRVFVLCLALLLAACPHGSAPAPGARIKPKLVVLVVIDQWPSWVFENQQKLFTAGLGRLMREGAIVMNGAIPYASTFTATGHASLGTGVTPNVHGIVGNTWWRRDDDKDRPAEFDRDAPTLSVGPALGEEGDPDGASGKALRSEGVADVLRRATAGIGHSVSISLKPRSACLMAGQKPDLAIWYDASAGGMTTSKAYASETPAWLAKLAKDYPASRYFGSTWDPRDPLLLARATKIADAAPGEKSDHGLGTAFPHSLAAAKNPAHAIIATPFADELVSQTVAVALDEVQLGKDAVPDLLAISFGAHDYAGHDWGPDSWEVLDFTLRLDSTLGQLFELLDARVGVDQWAVIVTSDHGATPVIERGRLHSARRIAPSDIEKAVDKAVAAQVGAAGPWVAKLVSSNVYMTAKFRELAEPMRRAALDAAVKAIRAVPGIAFAGRSDRFTPGCKIEQGSDLAICLSMVSGEAGELYVYPSAGSGITQYGGGTTHDAPFDDNRRVPIIVKAPGVAHQVGDGSLLQVAPTLAALLGIDPPDGAREPALFGIQRR